MEISNLPEQLETMEDYQKACDGFVVPFLFQQSKRVADVIEELHSDITSKVLDRERIHHHLNSMNEIAAFVQDGNPMFPYFEQLIELEQKLRANNEFDNNVEDDE
jgi:hypothetical protein